METPTLIPIELINPNPWQPRGTEDPEAVAEIAASIKQNGLMQIPTARRVNGHFQLAFGHTRLAAFKLNGEAMMPLIERELTDLQMFELGVSENIKRRDLNPIEQAEAMKRYMDEFHKTSAEAGDFFNVSPEKVRNSVRLLNLPEKLQDGVADGTITQGNARRLLTIQRVAPDQAEKVANKLKGDADPDRVIGEVLKDESRSVEMWQRWQSGEPLAGAKLWRITLAADKFPKSDLPELTAPIVARALEIEKSDDLQKWIGWLRMGFIHGPMAPSDKTQDESVAEYLIRTGAPEDVIERIDHLLNPPSCSSCPFYAKVDGSHYCTFRTCHTRKKHAWETHVIQSASKKLGIPVYNPKADGKEVGYLSSYDESNKKWVQEHNTDLRLKKGTNWNQHFDGVPEGYSIVVIGEALKRSRKASKQSQSTQSSDDYHKEQRRLAAMREAHQAAMYDFLWNVATPVFASLLIGVTNVDFLEQFSDRMVRGVPAKEPEKKTGKSIKQDFYRRALLFSLLDEALDTWEIKQKKQPVTAMAKDLQGLAKTWGVKLPGNWQQQAAEADKAIKIVSTETAKEPA